MSRRRPAVVAVVAVVLAVSAGLAVPARGRAQPAGPALEVVLLSVSPAVGPGTPLGYRVEVRNRGQVPLRDLTDCRHPTPLVKLVQRPDRNLLETDDVRAVLGQPGPQRLQTHTQRIHIPGSNLYSS